MGRKSSLVHALVRIWAEQGSSRVCSLGQRRSASCADLAGQRRSDPLSGYLAK
jgi:hypothetical protein